METNEILKLILNKLDNLEQGQVKLEQGQVKLEQGQQETNARLSTLEEDVAETNARLSTLEEDVAEINARLGTLEEDVAEIKENVAVTRHSTNLLLNWAEKTDNIMKVGLYQD